MTTETTATTEKRGPGRPPKERPKGVTDIREELTRMDEPEDEGLQRPDEPQPVFQFGEEIHLCGLPVSLVSDRDALTAYLQQWAFTHDEQKAMQKDGYTKTEREAFDLYRQANRRVPQPIMKFVAALRLWKSGDYPLKRKMARNILEMKVKP